MTVKITPTQVVTLNAYISTKDYAGGWAYLASIGDNYADNAYAVTTGLGDGLTDPLFHTLVHEHWENTAPGAYNTLFDDVALRHFEQYTQIIIDKNGELPNSREIEESYRKAVEFFDLPATTAFDGVYTNSLGVIADWLWPGPKHEGNDWTDWLGMEDERQVESDVFTDIPFTEAMPIIWQDIIDTLTTLGEENPIAAALLVGLFAGLISPSVAAYTVLAGILPNLRDPLAIDLDNSGTIETISSDEGILFDHSANGIKTGTGWVNPQDGWLVLDVNSNGIIDSGRELFGDNTIKLDGNRATDAFDALASFDTNADGKVDAADATGDANNSGVIDGSETFWDMNHNGVFDTGTKPLRICACGWMVIRMATPIPASCKHWHSMTLFPLLPAKPWSTPRMPTAT